MRDDTAFRTHLIKLLDWGDAHATFDAAVNGLEPRLRGVVPDGWDYSAWQLVEHLRIAQEDILQFCVTTSYKEMKWPDDYWPTSAAPPSAAAWDDAIDHYLADRKTAQALAADTTLDLGARIPHGSGQTYLRELLLIADHNAYHVGQLVLVRRLLGAWPAR
jgi:uncharacterized damage-inducible protein DinB